MHVDVYAYAYTVIFGYIANYLTKFDGINLLFP